MTRPSLSGRRTMLRAIEPSDYDYLYHLEVSSEVSDQWRFRGRTPSPDQYVNSLWDGVLVNCVIQLRESGTRVGIATAYGADLANGHAFIAVLVESEGQRAGAAMEGGALLIRHCFNAYDFRKLYAETLAPNYEAFKSGAGRLFEEEGRLRMHEYMQGKYVDKVLLAIYREKWQELEAMVSS